MQTQELEAQLNACGVPYMKNEPLKNHTTFKVGGPAAIFCEPENKEQLACVIKIANNTGTQFYFLGIGSNLLFADKGYDGIIIYIGKKWGKIEVLDNIVTAGAGASLKDVCIAVQQNSLTGLEFAYGIPGSVGGAVYMNAGAYGGETKDVVSAVTAMDMNGEVHRFSYNELELGYRMSVFQKNEMCILSAEFTLKSGNKEKIKSQMQEFMQKRMDKQPLELPSAGSAFKRPPGAFAGALIDQCGLRGYRVNDAAISEKHCGFIVNMGNATAKDIMQLADHVSATVKEKTGFTLEKEIRVIE